MMTVRQINSILWTMTALLGAGAVIVIIAGVLMPVTADDAAMTRRAAEATTRQTIATALPPLSEFEPVFNAQLRQTLGDQPAATQVAPVAVAAAAPPEPTPMTLVGTIGSSLAMFQASGGEVELKAVGESAAGMKVIAIRPSEVDVQLNGKLVTLHKPKQAGS